jgi:hypothetical protein
LARAKRVAKEPFLDVLAVAGTFVLALRNPDTVGDHSFQDVRMDCSKGRKSRRFGKGVWQGLFGCAEWPRILSKTAGARVETQSFFKGLIAWPA